MKVKQNNLKVAGMIGLIRSGWRTVIVSFCLAGLPIYSLYAVAQQSSVPSSENPKSNKQKTSSQPVGTVEASTIDEQALKFKLSTKLNSMYPDSNIEVTLFNTRVLLTGQVKSERIKAALPNIQAEYPEISSILNFVRVGPNQSSTQTSKDAWITTKIASKLLSTPGISSGEVKVVTSDGVVYLLGTVTKSSSIAIVNNCNRISGVRKVVTLFEYKSN